jgi:hypothetical protein
MGKQFLLTDYQRPLLWDQYGRFNPATISRGGVESKIGLDADTLDVTWSPQLTDILADDGGSPAVTLLTALQGFGAGVFDNGVLEVWRCVMLTPGDANSLGACLLFSGRIGDLQPDRLNVKISVISRMETLNIQVPTNLIEPTNIFAQYSVGMIPAGAPSFFTIASGSTPSKIYADASPTMPADTYDAGYLVITTGQLGGTYRRIRQQTVESGHHAFYLSEPLPFAATTGDLLDARVPVPRDFSGAVAAGAGVACFPFVPSAVNSSVVIA